MTPKRNLYFIVIFIVLVIIIFAPIKLPNSVTSKGKLLPLQTWNLERGTDGELITSLSDNSTGLNNEFSVTQFERGDAFQFKMNTDLLTHGNVNQGDTIGFLISNEIDREIQKLEGELKTAIASLNVQSSSEKESVIEAEKNKLAFAVQELNEQEKIFLRKKKLFEKELISQQEFEADEAKYELAKININIAEERLRTVQSGAKREEINFATSQINALKNEIDILQKRFESNNIIAPISGSISRTFSQDTLISILDLSRTVILIPIKWSDISDLNLDQKATISSSSAKEEIIGVVTEIDNNVKTIQGVQYVMVTVVSDDTVNELKPGLIVDCKIDCGELSPFEMLLNFFELLYN